MRRVLFGLLLALSAACEDKAAEEEGTTVFPPPTDEELGARPVPTPNDGFVYATGVTVMEAHAPTRFAAHLPANIEDYTYEGDFSAVPTAYVWSRLCSGDEAMRERVLAAVDGVGWAPEMEELFAGLINDCQTVSHCGWLTEIATSNRPQAVRMPFLRALHGCGREHAAPAFLLEEMPAFDVVNWYLQFVPVDSEDVPDEVERAVRRIASTPDAVFDQATLALVRYPGGEAAALIELLQDAEDRDAQTRPDGYGDIGVEPAALLDDACEVFVGAPQCPKFKGLPQDKYCIGSDLLYKHLTTNEKTAQLLAVCAQDETHQSTTRLAALERLAWQDWPAAKAIAAKLEEVPDFVMPTVETLRRFDSHEEMVEHLRDLGLLGERRFNRYGYVITPVEEMALGGRLRQFGNAEGISPARHDRLLFQMAELAGAALHDVVFEQLSSDEGAHVLRAYARGKRWTVEATNLGEEFDMRQTVGLLNVVLAELGSDERYALITSGTYTGWALGSKVGLTAAFLEGLFDSTPI